MQLNKTTTYIIVAVVIIIIIVAGIGVYLYTQGTGTTPSGGASPTPTASNTYTVKNATSLQFDVAATSSGTTTTLNFAGIHIGTSNLTVRVDYPAGKLSYILNYGTNTSYSSTNGGAWTADDWTQDVNSWGVRWTDEVAALGNWTGSGNYTYTTVSGGVSTDVTVYNIQVQPSLAESLFSTSASSTTNTVADATSMQFSANVTSQGQTTEYKWQGINIHGNNATLRVDFSTYAYILDAGAQKSWASTNSGTTWTASNFTSDWGTTAAPGFGSQWQDYLDNLTHWNGSDATYSYTDAAGETIVLFNIVVNPTIPASTFTAS